MSINETLDETKYQWPHFNNVIMNISHEHFSNLGDIKQIQTLLIYKS